MASPRFLATFCAISPVIHQIRFFIHHLPIVCSFPMHFHCYLTVAYQDIFHFHFISHPYSFSYSQMSQSSFPPIHLHFIHLPQSFMATTLASRLLIEGLGHPSPNFQSNRRRLCGLIMCFYFLEIAIDCSWLQLIAVDCRGKLELFTNGKDQPKSVATAWTWLENQLNRDQTMFQVASDFRARALLSLADLSSRL